jgi:hypothetical protein
MFRAAPHRVRLPRLRRSDTTNGNSAQKRLDAREQKIKLLALHVQRSLSLVTDSRIGAQLLHDGLNQHRRVVVERFAGL